MKSRGIRLAAIFLSFHFQCFTLLFFSQVDCERHLGNAPRTGGRHRGLQDLIHVANPNGGDAVQLHHVAYLTKNIDRKADELCRLLGVSKSGEAVIDPGQGVRIVFLDLGGTQLELIEPAGEDSPVAKRVMKSPGLFHLCFEVDDLEETLRRLEASDEATVIKRPQAAPAIGHRRVAFVVTAGNDLIEFVERQAEGKT